MTKIIALTVLGLFFSSSSLAQTFAKSCEYYGGADRKDFTGPCLETQTSSPGQDPYTIKISMPAIDLEIKYLKHQGPYHRWTINGVNAAAYEVDRTNICGFTDDLSVSVCIRSAGTPKAAAKDAPDLTVVQPFYVGRWHIDNPRLCRGNPGQTEGLLTFTDHEFIGLENRCEIKKTTPNGNRVELRLMCNGEGMVSHDREILQLLRSGRLSRTTFDGARPQTFEYARCP
jgi:hypothetical protein